LELLRLPVGWDDWSDIVDPFSGTTRVSQYQKVKKLFESIDSHAVIVFIKKHIFVISCNVCYLDFILAL